MMIGGGGIPCSRADHGIGITESDVPRFGDETRDFGDEASHSVGYMTSYGLNLWIK